VIEKMINEELERALDDYWGQCRMSPNHCGVSEILDIFGDRVQKCIMELVQLGAMVKKARSLDIMNPKEKDVKLIVNYQPEKGVKPILTYDAYKKMAMDFNHGKHTIFPYNVIRLKVVTIDEFKSLEVPYYKVEGLTIKAGGIEDVEELTEIYLTKKASSIAVLDKINELLTEGL
jgi:hypothetical protein